MNKQDIKVGDFLQWDDESNEIIRVAGINIDEEGSCSITTNKGECADLEEFVPVISYTEVENITEMFWETIPELKEKFEEKIFNLSHEKGYCDEFSMDFEIENFDEEKEIKEQIQPYLKEYCKKFKYEYEKGIIDIGIMLGVCLFYEIKNCKITNKNKLVCFPVHLNK